MRASVPIGAALAGSLIGRSDAQATAYGTPSESPTGDSNGPFGGMPSSHASLQPGGKSGNSGSLPGQTGATCPSQETTTVFVTVYPTNGAQHSGTGMSGGSGGGHSSPHSIKSAHSVDVSAVLGSLLTVSSVKPFTTVTIDIWGPGSGSNGGSGKGSGSGPSDGSGNGSGPVVSASGSAPAYTAGGGVSGGSNGQISASQPSQTGDSGIHGGNSNGGAASTALAVSQQGPNGASGTAPSYGNGGGSGEKGSAGLPLTTANGGGESRLGPASYTTVTDTDIKWTEGPNGPTQITIVSEQTIPVGGAATSSPANGGSGQGGGQGSGHGPPAYQTGSGFGGHFSTIGPNGQSTVMGPIGLSTDHNGHVPFSSFPLPNGLTPHAPTFASTAAAASLTAGALTTTCISYTIVGSNGLPTIVETTWVIPATAASPVPSTYGHGPLSSQGFAPGNSNEASGALPTGIPSLSVANSGIPPGMGKTTCTSFTTIGPNGLPTIVESTYVIPAAQSTPDFTGGVPGPVVTQDSTALGAGMPASSGAVGGPFRPGITTCVSYTIIGSNGYPTIVESTYVVPGPAKTGSGPPWNTAGAASGGLPPSSPTQFTVPEGSPSQVISGGSVITTETCFTILGPNGKPTVIDTTIIIPTANSPTGIQGSPSGASSAVAVGFSSSMTSGIGQPVVTTKTYFTVLGPNGQPTVTEATIVVPVPSNAQTGIPYLSGPSSNFPSVITAGVPGQGTGQPGYPPQQGALTTCTSYTIIGSDGRPTVVETTWTIPAGNEFPTATSLGLPQESSTGFPGGSAGSPSNAAGNGGVTICTTETIVGPNGLATPVVETIILPTGAGNGFSYSTALAATAGFPPFPKSIPAVDSSSMSLPGTSIPSLSAYGSGNLFPPGGPGLPPIDSGSILGASTAEATFASGTVMGTLTSTYTVVVPNGVSAVSGVSPMPLPAYTGVFGNGEPNPSGPGHFSSLGGGAAPSEETLWPTPKYGATDAPATPSGNAPCPTTSVSIGTWANIIPDETTTYTIDFPFSTLITLRVPKTSPLAKRAFRRQFSPAPWSNSSSTASQVFPENTSLAASLSSALGGSVPTPTLPGSSAPTMCAAGGKIGNTTVNFDNLKPGTLINPTEDIWFSEGFLVIPPSSQPQHPYVPTSGGQLVEYVPPSLSSPTSHGSSGDTAEIGLGPNSVNPCFRFNFYGASLGCAALPTEEWCEFEISAYTYDESLSREESISWSEIKRVPACPRYPYGPCALTPVEFDGYTNITSVLITLHVGLDLRVWWGDDFEFGWTDDSCDAAACRASLPSSRVKRGAAKSFLRRGVWH